MKCSKMSNEQIFSADIFLAQSWLEPRLKAPEERERIIPLEWIKDLWTPDTFIKNAKSIRVTDRPSGDETHQYLKQWPDHKMVHMSR